MKTLLTITGLLLFITQGSFGQILEKDANMSLGVQTANQVVLEDMVPKEAVKLWKAYFKEYGKIKKNSKAKEYYSTGVKINRIFPVSNIDLYTRFEERGSNTTMSMWVDLGTAFVNSADHPDEYKGVVELIDDFRIHARKHVIQQELEDAEDDLKKMKKELVKLEKKNVKLHEDIVNYENKILKAKDDIDKNVISQDEKKIDIDKQLELLKEIQFRMENIK